jgi:hypothetical protein
MTKVARNALVRAHHQNINRYCRLLATNLTEQEREYVHRRIVEERLALERVLKQRPFDDEPPKPLGAPAPVQELATA